MHREEARCRTRTMQRTTTREMNREETRGPGKRRTREEDDDQGRGRPATTTTKWRRDDDDEVEARRRRGSDIGFAQIVGQMKEVEWDEKGGWSFDEMEIDVNSDKPEMPQIESEEYQPLVLVQPPTLSCTFGTPYKGVKVRERLQIFYNVDTFVLDEPDTIDFFVLEVPNELLNLKEGVHVSLPKYVDVPFVVDISKGEGIT
ncbi:hypothetical protein Syun_023232 [Stephania yunnanensis]|uniref:Uncharacterized protein n=1 Tax=Stephania yunnanensis TaxID=152371 RepID=A0AAP0I390_9MAGN